MISLSERTDYFRTRDDVDEVLAFTILIFFCFSFHWSFPIKISQNISLVLHVSKCRLLVYNIIINIITVSNRWNYAQLIPDCDCSVCNKIACWTVVSLLWSFCSCSSVICRPAGTYYFFLLCIFCCSQSIVFLMFCCVFFLHFFISALFSLQQCLMHKNKQI